MKQLKYLALLMIVPFFLACEQDNAVDFSQDFVSLRTYSDSAVTGDNPAFSISAGHNRLYMTYGYKYFFMQANNVVDYTNLQPVVMATDNHGNYLWKRVLPEAFEECAVAAMDNGGCIVASQVSFGSNAAYSQTCFYLFQFNSEGVLVKTDSVSVAPYITTTATSNNYINSIRTSDGRLIFYGDFWGRDAGYVSGFAFEYSPVSGMVWFKDYVLPFNGSTNTDLLLHGCVQTEDFALLYSGSRTFYDSQGNAVTNLILMKTSLAGDILWSREYSGGSSYLKGGIVRSTVGNYLTFHNTAQGQILEVNANGDSLRSVSLSPNRFISCLTPSDDGGSVAMVNSSPYNSFAATWDPKYYQENTSRMVFDKELNKIKDSPFQTKTSDFLPVSCRTSKGELACFGIIQSAGKTYYVPQLYLSK